MFKILPVSDAYDIRQEAGYLWVMIERGFPQNKLLFPFSVNCKRSSMKKGFLKIQRGNNAD